MQDALSAKSELILGLWKSGAHIWICGGHAMGAAVLQVLKEVLGDELLDTSAGEVASLGVASDMGPDSRVLTEFWG